MSEPLPRTGGLPAIQRRVWVWCTHVFAERPGWQEKRQRVQRFIEEALELAQACDVPREDMERLVSYVYGRPVGDPQQELGGTVITLAALAEALGLDAEAAGFDEMERVERPDVSEKVRAKQKAKDALFEPVTSHFRAGDRVKHAPSGETWILACDEIDGRVLPAGWPETLAQAEHCTLVEAASDEKRLEMLRDVAGGYSSGNGVSYRRSVARTQLSEVPR